MLGLRQNLRLKREQRAIVVEERIFFRFNVGIEQPWRMEENPVCGAISAEE
jgi:hypothetical protein